MNPLLQQLHDIEGLDPISAWPLAMGWWTLIGIGIFAFCAMLWFIVRWLAFKRSWQNDTLQKLQILETNLSDTTARESAVILSEYLRRIVIRRFSRKECAGLMGEMWLKWLSMHDPKQFDWEKRGVILILAPYAPVNHQLSAKQVKDLIQASREWVR